MGGTIFVVVVVAVVSQMVLYRQQMPLPWFAN